jgi:hypothetical protein
MEHSTSDVNGNAVLLVLIPTFLLLTFAIDTNPNPNPNLNPIPYPYPLQAFTYRP